MSSSKKYKGHSCPYCVVAVSTSVEHVFARGFFLEEDCQRALKTSQRGALKLSSKPAILQHRRFAVTGLGEPRQEQPRNGESAQNGRHSISSCVT